MTTRDNSHFVIATLSEFLKVWDLGEDASLHLETTQGHVTMAFSCKLGLPSAPHPNPTVPPPPSAKVKPHHRGPAQREKNRQRAALYQAAKVVQKPAAPAVTSSLSAPTTVSVVNTHPAPITAPVITPSPTPVTTSAPVVACSPSITTPVSISSPVATPTPFTGPVQCLGHQSPLVSILHTYSITQSFHWSVINVNFLVCYCVRCKITGKKSTGFGNVPDVVILLSINNLLTSMVVVPENGITTVLSIHLCPLM